MKNYVLKILLILCSISGITAFAADFNVRITREEFADFYGILIIEENFKGLSLDGVFSSGFDPLSGKLKRDEIFSVRSAYFKPDIFKKKEKEKPGIPENYGENKGIYNVRLSSKPEIIKKTFKDNLLAAKNIIESGKNPGQAEEILMALEKTSDNNPVNISNIAKLYLKGGNRPRALELLKRAKELAPDDYKILYTYGIALYKNDELNRAEVLLLEITRIKPDFMYAHYNLGNIYYKRKEYKKALDSFEKAMELAPDKADIYFNIAITLEQLGYSDMASRFYSKCLELNPDDDEAFKALQRLE